MNNLLLDEMKHFTLELKFIVTVMIILKVNQ